MASVPPLTAATTTSQAQSAIAQYDLAYQVSPIILVGGIASSAQGGLLPIVALYGQMAILNSGTTDPNAFFARYLPLPGSTLISNQVGMYPFANQNVAANALIAQPLTLSMLMIAPVNQPGGYLSKLSTFTALQNALQQHCIAAGTFSIATPAYVYANLILTAMTDVTHGENQQRQTEWQLDFIQPLLTAQAAAAAQSNLLSKISSGASLPATPSWSGNPQAPYPPVAPGLPGATAPSSAYVPD